MTPEAQRIAIAEALGIKTFPRHRWKGHDDNRYFKCLRCAETIGWGEYSKNKGIFAHPCSGTEKNFRECLNAMHEAEEVLDDAQCRVYNDRLAKACVPISALVPPFTERRSETYTFHASAPQRAEAFLRTLNKWDDTK